jgi:FAD:protein FMN transferase
MTVATRAASPRIEHRREFDCFGGRCTVLVADAARPGDAAAAASKAERVLLEWHRRFSRFEPDSELSRLNRDPRATVPVSPLMRRLVEAGARAARDTGGLVDATLADDIRDAGYGSHFEGEGIPLRAALAAAPPREPAGPSRAQRWRELAVDRGAGTVTRPPGTGIDLGGIAKGVFADELAALLAGFDAFALDCAGDVRIGGRARLEREVHIEGAFDQTRLHTFALAGGGIATSGIGRRSWVGADGSPAHHLLDPCTGRPAFTGVVQATALAPTATEAEALAKAAVLSGPERAAEWLAHGGVVVHDDGSYAVLEPAGSRVAVATRALPGEAGDRA